MPLSPQDEKTYESLKKVRASTTVALKPTPMLRSQVRGLDGRPQDFKLRYYQVQGVFHLLSMKRMLLGDGTGLGKTVQVIAALCYLRPREPENRIIIVTPKSALRQWGEEIERFTTGTKCFVVSGSPEERVSVYEAWARAPVGGDAPLPILIVNYALLIRDWDHGKKIDTPKKGKPVVTPGLVDRLTTAEKHLAIVFDEATAFKNFDTKTWQTCKFLSERAHRCYALTATLLKNKLMEGFSIYKVIVPGLFGTKTAFMDQYCYVEMQKIAFNRKIPVVVGYKNLDDFRARIDPYYLGRAKHMVSAELPKLTTKQIVVKLSAAEDQKYQEALSGVLELGDGSVKDYEEHKAFVALCYCQQVVDSLTLLKYKPGDEIVPSNWERFDEAEVDSKVKTLGSKEQAFRDLITDELDGEKVIVYTRFESLVGRLVEVLKAEGIKSVRITGREKEKARLAAQKAFQDLESDTQVIFITDAGSEAINLQAASALVFYDAPWSWGNYVQTLGRPIRIGSPHPSVCAYHIVAERPRTKPKEKKTIDHHILSLLQSKKTLIDKVLGEAAVGALTFEAEGSSTKDLLRRMRGDDGDEV